MDILNWLYLAKNKFVRTTVSNPTDLMVFGAKVGFDKRGDLYQNYAMKVSDFSATLPTGPTGAQGVQGPAGVPGPVGPAGLTWRSTFVPGTSYILNDAVGYNGASYYCILATSSATVPSSNTTNWALLASQGAIGPQGLQGPTGPQGPSGTAGSYLVYSAKISQTGTAAPTLTVKTDTMGGGGIWYRFNPGYYYLAGNATLSSLPNSRVMLFFTKDYLTYGVVTASCDAGSIYINTYNAAGALTDGLLNGSSIEIRVYPS